VRHQQHHQQSNRRQQQAAAAQTRLPAPAAAQQQPMVVPAAVERGRVRRWLMSTLLCLRGMTQMMMRMMRSCWRTLMTMKTWTQSSCSS